MNPITNQRFEKNIFWNVQCSNNVTLSRKIKFWKKWVDFEIGCWNFGFFSYFYFVLQKLLITFILLHASFDCILYDWHILISVRRLIRNCNIQFFDGHFIWLQFNSLLWFSRIGQFLSEFIQNTNHWARYACVKESSIWKRNNVSNFIRIR